MGTLAQVTSSAKWDGGDDPRAGSAKPIGFAQWSEALTIAVILDRAVPGLPVVVPSADPLGFIWLRWKTETADLSLRLRSSLVGDRYCWDRVLFGIKSTHYANSLQDLAEALRGVFGQTEAARIEA